MNSITSPTFPQESGARASGITLALVTYNQAELLVVFLENYRRHGNNSVPLLVVDDGSTDATPGVLEDARKRLSASCFRIPHGGAAKARNEALRRCPTPWIAFSDTDCILAAEYFLRLPEIPVRYGAHPAVEGAVHPPAGPKPPFTHSLSNPSGGTYATANMAFDVAAIRKLGGFDEGFPDAFREDVDLALTVTERLGPIPFWPELQVVHPHLPRNFWPALFRAWDRHARMLRAEIRLYRKHSGTYRLVRRHPDAAGTLGNWCRHWCWLYLRECWTYLAFGRGLGLRALWVCLRAATVAAWEQICIAAWCAFRWRDIAKGASA